VKVAYMGQGNGCAACGTARESRSKSARRMSSKNVTRRLPRCRGHGSSDVQHPQGVESSHLHLPREGPGLRAAVPGKRLFVAPSFSSATLCNDSPSASAYITSISTFRGPTGQHENRHPRRVTPSITRTSPPGSMAARFSSTTRTCRSADKKTLGLSARNVVR